MELVKLLFITIICLLPVSCYYQHDLDNQSMGSLAGATVGGLVLSGSMGGIAAGVVGGSMLGSDFGQKFDNHTPFAREIPLLAPVHRYCYQMVRPQLTRECFTSGDICYSPRYHVPVIRNNPPTVNQLD